MPGRRSSVLAAVAGCLLLASANVSGRMGPSVLMFYGPSLSKPVFIVDRTVEDFGTYANFWGGNSYRVIAAQLVARPYVNIAIFWRPWLDQADPTSTEAFLATLKPDQAHQHGRLYVATREVRAAVVTTDYARMMPRPSGTPAGGPSLPFVQQVPDDPREFKYGAWLTEPDLRIARKLGVPVGVEEVR